MIRTVLVIDDDELVRSALSRALKEAEFEVTTAADGEEGLKAALDSRPDLIISDLLMPNLGGLDMLERLRKDDWGKTARVIVLSSDESATSLNESLEAGVTVYLSKNNTGLDELVRQISALG